MPVVVALLVLAMLGCAPMWVNARSMYALVIGNGAYQSGPLRNPVNDATDMAETLVGFGFTGSRG